MDTSPRTFACVFAGLVALALLAAFTLSSSLAAMLQGALLLAALGLSFQVVYTLLGQLSLGHSALFGAGAYTYAFMTVSGYPQPLAVVCACLLGAVVGLIVSGATARLGGAYFAVVTFALASVIHVVVSSSESLGSSEGLVGIPSFSALNLGAAAINQTLYVSAAFLAVLLASYLLWRSRFGWMLLAIRTNPRLAASLGINVISMTMLATAVSGVMAGLVGAVAAQQMRFVGPDIFGLYYIVTPLAAVVIGGAHSLAGAVAGVVIVFVIPVALSVSPVVNQVVSGLLLAVFAIFFPAGIMGVLARLKPGRKPAAAAGANARVDYAAMRTAASGQAAGEVLLQAEGVNVAYGGVKAVTDMALTLRSGEITGLIGANGAGKSSLVNALSGHIRDAKGRLQVMGAEGVARRPAYARARGGLARTFQDNAVIDVLTVRQSVLLARARGRLTRAEAADAPGVDAIIAACGLAALAQTKVGRLSYMPRRMTALAMAVAMNTRILFLDEATAGMTADERAQIAGFLKALAREHRMAVLVIEHDVDFVASVADRIVVMDEGALLTQGAPAAVLRDPKVVAAYLGEEWHGSQPV